ncbi:hypothetical protein B0H10DRAFT_2227936 [Mycena sp. CBHHK59/15]|nr:hypothetical protein B0H10DRAFT_2227936 [Mycena sp. CBHHK59/15]
MDFNPVLQYFARHLRVLGLAAAIVVGTPWVIGNYNKFLALGAHNPLKLWLIATPLTALGRETTSTEEYDKDPNKETWLDRPVERRGARPTLGWHCVPHRQIDRLPTDKFAKRLDAIFAEHAAANPTLIQVVTSPHEKWNSGMVIHTDIPSPHKEADQAWREIAHVHPIDHSLHAVLSPADCKTVIELGWAERHPLSGVSRVFPLPKNYLLVYAPRDEEELQVVERILVASIGYMTASHSVV